MTVVPQPPPAFEGVAGLRTCAELARDIFLSVRCAATATVCGTAHDFASHTRPSGLRTSYKVHWT